MDAIYLGLSTIFTLLLHFSAPTAVDELQRALPPTYAQAPTTTITTTVATTVPVSVTLEDAGSSMSAVLERVYDEQRSTPHTSATTAAQSQRAATTCLVTSPTDAGDGSLRSCLTNAVSGDVIEFDPVQFPPFNPMSITLDTPLPVILVDNLFIDGSNAGVVLLGDSLSAGDGLVVDGADGVVIRGLQIKRFPGSGIVLKGGTTNSVIGGDRGVGAGPLGQGNLLSENGKSGVQIEDAESRDNLVIGNYIGVDISGTQAAGNFVGISVLSATSNTIGSGVEGQGNLISGNLSTGVLVHAATGNQILGNTIGTDKTGTLPLGNVDIGISLYEGASDNVIGGLNAGEGNLISDHKGSGISIAFASDRNMLIGNSIGTDRSGTRSVGNRIGIVLQRANHNTIGGTQTGARNLISGNVRDDEPLHGYGIHVGGSAAYNQIMGNYIGVAADGESALPNKDGIVIVDGHHNLIGHSTVGNLISGNLETGVWLSGVNSTENHLFGNLIGPNQSGQIRLGSQIGIIVQSGSQKNTIGGFGENERNLISGNYIAVAFEGPGTTGNQVLGNYIGTNISGTQAISNTLAGVYIGNGATRNVVGGDVAGARNLISGNGAYGVRIETSSIITGGVNNRIIGNYIGTNADGTEALSNSEGIFIFNSNYNQIGGVQPGESNLISGNVNGGLTISGAASHSNRVIGNQIGPDFTGTQIVTVPQTNKPLDLQAVGVALMSEANNNIIGGVQSSARNIISGNIEGVSIGQEAHSNRIIGNYVGTDLSGSVALSNNVGIILTINVIENQIGGSEPGASNLISGNSAFGIVISQDGTDKNQILGNIIGTDISGRKPLGNGSVGIIVGGGAAENIIGGEAANAGNLISGNGFAGVVVFQEGTANNHLFGNIIGTDITQLMTIPNGSGILVIDGADANLIGGETPNSGNLISGNLLDGIYLAGADTTNNQIANNQIGVAGDGLTSLGNGGAGIVLTDTTKFNTIGISNTIAHNGEAGIFLSTTETSANTITRNRIHDNQGGQIVHALVGGTVGLDFTIHYYQAATGVITGTTCAGCTVEFFANATAVDAGTRYLGQTTAGRDGSFTMDLGGPAPMPHLTATVTKPDRTTFGFYLVQVQQSTLWLPVIAR